MSQIQLIQELERLSNEAFRMGYGRAARDLDTVAILIATGDESQEEASLWSMQ